MYKKVMIIVGEGSASRPAIVEGVALAKAHGAEVLFFAVLPRYVMPLTEFPIAGVPSPDEFQRQASSNADRQLTAAAATAHKAGVRSSHAIGSGADDAECIVDAARKRHCGLIVVASAGRNAVMRLLSGSVIPGLITLSTIPVLVVRQATRAERVRRHAAAPAGTHTPRRTTALPAARQQRPPRRA